MAVGEIASSLEAQSATVQQPEAAQPAENHFFTLPVALKAIEWDLRSELVDFDEMLPLAESVAAFRDEVTLFQQSDRRNVEDSSDISDGTSESAQSDSHATASRKLTGDMKAPDDSLVAQSRRRLESMEKFRSTGGIMLDEQFAATAQLTRRNPVLVHSQPELELPISSREPDSDNSAGVVTKGSSHVVEASIADSAPVASTTPQFGQLFTRLRQKRGQSGES